MPLPRCQRQLPYDFLIRATGIQYNYFGHNDCRSVAPGLESLDDADLIRAKVLTAFDRAEEAAAFGKTRQSRSSAGPDFRARRCCTVGVEMAGTLAEMSRMALARDFRNVDTRSARILLYEAAPRILPTFPESLSAAALRHLESLDVEVHTNTRVTGVDGGGIVADGKRIPACAVLWGAGVLASPSGRCTLCGAVAAYLNSLISTVAELKIRGPKENTVLLREIRTTTPKDPSR